MKIIKIEWATQKRKDEFGYKSNPSKELSWSRDWEYPWVKEQLKDINMIDILDVGATPDGHLKYILEKKNDCTVTKIDVDDLDDVDIVGSIRDRSLIKNEYDIVMSISTIEHDEDALDCIKAMLEACKDCGKVILTMDVSVNDSYSIQINKFKKIAEFLGVDGNIPDDVLKSEDCCAYPGLRVVGLVIEKK
jgi:hypothetical protein